MKTGRGREFFLGVLIAILLVAVFGTPRALPAAEDLRKIRQDLDDIDWEVRRATVEKLRNARDVESVNLLIRVASTREERTPVKITAIQLLGEAGDPRAIEVLLPIFNDATLNWECPAIKSYVATALGNFKGDKRVVDALISGIDDRELLTREASIQSLGKIHSTKAVPYLLRVLNDEHISIRLSAIRALGEIGNAEAVPSLERVAESDGDPFVKDQAKIALGKLHQNRANN